MAQAAVYGGSYGWASAGRFHHAQSQVHRFLNVAFGGYVRSVNSYSAGASAVILPHILGSFEGISRHNVTWDQVAEHTDTVLAFGGMALKNSDVASGGISRHIERDAMEKAARRGAVFYGISPLRDDMPQEAGGRWLPIKVGTDVALMLALAHTLLVENLWDSAFVARYCTGFEIFERYLLGRDDNTPKDAAWAAGITGIPAGTIVDIARRLSRGRTLITVSHSLQRAQYGEQPVWMGAVLAAMLGQIGLPGGGYNYALGALGHTGRRLNAVPIPTLSQGKNGVSDHIPVARVADMLLNPGERFEYNGRSMAYPDIKLVYWAGGNPFHHHQDINRLRQAFNVPQTIVVHESAWTPMAKFADIVLPATMTLERDDIGAAGTDPRLIAMRRAVDPIGEARDDFDIFAALSRRMGVEQAFTEGRDTRQWLAHLYEPTRQALADAGWDAPDFDEFWQRGELALPSAPDDGGFLRAFRNDPLANKLPTPSGKNRDLFATPSRASITTIARPPGMAAVDRAAGFSPPVDADRQPAVDPAAQSARLRCLQPVEENCRPRSCPSQRCRCSAPRHRQRRHRPPVQRSRRVPGSRRRNGRRHARRAAIVHRRLVRSRARRGGTSALRPWQSERAHPRHRHIAAGTRLLRPGDGGRVREV